MKKSILLALALSLLLMLSACGTSSDSTPSNNNSDDKPSSTIPDNTPSNDIPASGSSVTDDFLKTITAETAEATGVCGADLTWYYKDNVLVIRGTGEMTDWGSDYGSDYGAPWSEKSGSDLYKKINWVIIDEGVTSIGTGAFYKCKAISKVVLPTTLEKINDSAFNECLQLKEITIPSSVTYIGRDAFYGFDLENITFLGDTPENIPQILGEAVAGGG